MSGSVSVAPFTIRGGETRHQRRRSRQMRQICLWLSRGRRNPTCSSEQWSLAVGLWNSGTIRQNKRLDATRGARARCAVDSGAWRVRGPWCCMHRPTGQLLAPAANSARAARTPNPKIRFFWPRVRAGAGGGRGRAPAPGAAVVLAAAHFFKFQLVLVLVLVVLVVCGVCVWRL
jgi:hypothetical protein